MYILLGVLYLAVTTGLTVASHYCGGILVSSDVVAAPLAEPAWCCPGEDDEEMDCCSDAVTTLVLHEDHTGSGTASDIPLTAQVLALLPVSPASSAPQAFVSPHAAVGHPPGQSSLILLHCTLLI